MRKIIKKKNPSCFQKTFII